MKIKGAKTKTAKPILHIVTVIIKITAICQDVYKQLHDVLQHNTLTLKTYTDYMVGFIV